MPKKSSVACWNRAETQRARSGMRSLWYETFVKLNATNYPQEGRGHKNGHGSWVWRRIRQQYMICTCLLVGIVN